MVTVFSHQRIMILVQREQQHFAVMELIVLVGIAGELVRIMAVLQDGIE